MLILFRRFVLQVCNQPVRNALINLKSMGRVGKHQKFKMARHKLLLCAAFLMLESEFDEVKKRRRQFGQDNS